MKNIRTNDISQTVKKGIVKSGSWHPAIKSIFVLILALTMKFSAFSQPYTGPTLNHIAIYVANLQKSTAFYKDILGLEITPEPFKDGKHTWFKLGDHSQLHIIEGAKSGNGNDRNSHMCLRTASVKSFIDKLDENHIPYSNAKGEAQSVTVRPDGVQQIYFQDPDGFWIEINDDKL